MEIKVMQKILNENDQIAQQNRKELEKQGIVLINLMSSPGSGKTSLIENTVKSLDHKISVIEGDIQTTLDAERIAKLGIETYQINTGPFGGDCHLEAAWIKNALGEMGTEETDLIFVENIGNLVCPAEFDIGAHHNVLVLSVTEGEDKPLKYPLAFRNSSVCLISKIDLLPYLDIDMDKIKSNISKVNPQAKIIEISNKTGEGLENWYEFLISQIKK
ncbi:MAG: hydrogenase nickel incorporation protein HypB [bacterium]